VNYQMVELSVDLVIGHDSVLEGQVPGLWVVMFQSRY